MNNNLVEGQFGHGATKNKIDLRDKKYHKTKLAKASLPFDWSKGYDIEDELRALLNNPSFKIPIKNQNGSSSCCGQAGAYYMSVLDAFEKGAYTEKSARDIYSQIFYPGGGSTTRDVLNLLIKKGVCKESLMPSYNSGQPPSERFMESRLDASDITRIDASSSKGTAYASVAIDIDSFAQAIRDNHGLIATINGQNGNNPSWLSKTPSSPVANNQSPIWGHEIYYGKAKYIGSLRCVGIPNSWGINDTEGNIIGDPDEPGWQWVTEKYFKNGYIHSSGVLYDSPADALKQEKSWLEQVLDLLQKLLFGLNTKIIHS